MQTSRRISSFLSVAILFLATLNSSLPALSSTDNPSAVPSLTVYNQGFAVIRQKLPLDLKSGINHVQITDITAHLEPDSVILRPLDAAQRLQILEQNYRNDPITQSLLLSLNEGKTIEFVQTDKDGNQRVVQGKIIRSGYVPPGLLNLPNGQQPYPQPAPNAPNGAEQPVIEVNGKLQFSLPGQPVFPTLADDTILKPTLSWELETDKPGPPPAGKLRRSVQSQGLGHGGIQEQLTEPSRHAPAEGPGAFLPPRR